MQNRHIRYILTAATEAEYIGLGAACGGVQGAEIGAVVGLFLAAGIYLVAKSENIEGVRELFRRPFANPRLER